ncbi:TELO2-interacting protein 2 [Pelodytes ibericus]
MAAMQQQQQQLLDALAEVSQILGRPPRLLRAASSCAELLHALVTWAAVGPDPENDVKAPERAAVAARVSLRLLEVIRVALQNNVQGTPQGESAESEPGTDVTSAEIRANGSAEAEPSVSCAESSPAEEGDGPPATVGTGSLTDNLGDGNPDPVVLTEDAKPDLGSAGLRPLTPRYVLRCAAAPLLILCGAHTGEQPWTSQESRRLTAQLLRALLDVSNVDHVSDLLRGPGDQETGCRTFRGALAMLGPRLRKDTWESHPDAKLAFTWMLYQVPRPYLSEFLAKVMPPSLLFSDDYKLENKVLGIRCLHHIIKNVPAAEFRQYNRALVVYHALRNHLHTTNPEIIEVVLPCLVDLMPVIQKPPPAIGEYNKGVENPTDQVMQMVLISMEVEHRIPLRRLYARHLSALQERLEIRVVRHMKRLMGVIIGYLEVYDGPEETSRICILETLQGTIKYAWPRIPSKLPILLRALLKLIYEITCEPYPSPEPVVDSLLNGAAECLLLLERCCKGQVKAALKGISSVCNEPKLLKCLRKVQKDV